MSFLLTISTPSVQRKNDGAYVPTANDGVGPGSHFNNSFFSVFWLTSVQNGFLNQVSAIYPESEPTYVCLMSHQDITILPQHHFRFHSKCKWYKRLVSNSSGIELKLAESIFVPFLSRKHLGGVQTLSWTCSRIMEKLKFDQPYSHQTHALLCW